MTGQYELGLWSDGGTVQVKADVDGLACLTDLWKRAGSPHRKRPTKWKELEEVKEFIEQVKVPSRDIKTLKGKYGGTYAPLQVALKYAQYLDPAFQEHVNAVFIERIEEEADPELGVQRAIDRQTAKLRSLNRTDEDIVKRIKGITKRNTLTSTLATHGVGVDGWNNGFARVTEAEYLGWKGMTTKQIREELEITKKENPRDHFSGYELDQISFLESTLEEKIRRDNLYGNSQCASTAHMVGKTVAKLVQDVMGPQLEARN